MSKCECKIVVSHWIQRVQILHHNLGTVHSYLCNHAFNDCAYMPATAVHDIIQRLKNLEVIMKDHKMDILKREEQDKPKPKKKRKKVKPNDQ